MEKNMIYRVLARTTDSLKPGSLRNTKWSYEFLYCGQDRQAARIVYHSSTPKDSGGCFHQPARITVIEEIDEDDSVIEMYRRPGLVTIREADMSENEGAV